VFRSVLGSVLGFTPLLASADTDTLWRAVQSLRQQTYQGELVYQSSGRVQTLKVHHRYKSGQEHERLTITSQGEQHEVFRHNDRVMCVLPHKQVMTLQRPPLSLQLGQLNQAQVQQLQNLYQIEALGERRVAGRACEVWSLRPKKKDRYGYDFCLDKATALPLSIVLQAGEGRESVHFSHIHFPSHIEDGVFQPPSPFVADTAVPLASMPYRLKKLPEGFALTRYEKIEGDVEHLLISDGLNSVSVFMGSSLPALEGVGRLGALHATGRQWKSKPMVVLGEVPASTVQMIAAAFE
jgi:sigma-E factor negative regulatory protein RseB